MAKLSVEKIKVNAAVLASLFFVAAASFLLVFGGLSLAKDSTKVIHYQKTICTIRNISWKTINHMQFYGLLERYVAAWGLDHNGHRASAQGTKQYIFPESALVEANKYKMHSSHSCWYDERHPSIAQLNKPTLYRAIILTICGILSFIYTVLFLLLSHRFIREKEHQDEQNTITQIHVTFLK